VVAEVVACPQRPVGPVLGDVPRDVVSA
jgi:hypothetical protein